MSELTPITRKEHIMSGTDITPITREEMFLQKIVEGGGGGGGLPAYTSADKGKVLTVGEDAENPKTINIVPQQTVVLTQDDVAAELTGYDFSGVSVGDTLTLTVDGHSETVTVITGGGVELAVAATYSVQGGQQTVQIGFVTGTGAGFDCLFRGTGGDTATRKPGTYTVSLTKSVPSVAPVWQTGGGGGLKVLQCFTGKIPNKTGGGEVDATVNIWRFAASIAGNDINTFRVALVDHDDYEKLTSDDSVVIVDFSNGDLFYPVAAPSLFGRNALGASVPIGPPSDNLFDSGTWLEPKELSTITFAYFNPQIADIQSNSTASVLIVDASAVVRAESVT